MVHLLALTMTMTMGMRMGLAVFTQWHYVNIAVTYAAQGDQHLRKQMDGFSGTAQHHSLQAIVVVYMSMQAGNNQIMVLMLQRQHPFGDCVVVVVVDVVNGGYAPQSRRGLQIGFIDPRADQVPHCLRAIVVAAGRNKRIKLDGQRVVQ